ncbi:nucleoside triphosphate pyrophosphohydrolase [Francisellaceae bacterium]|nr:nucleoside triphosphate pyrophosphohydrolase [Francisellaceae bacterium]
MSIEKEVSELLAIMAKMRDPKEGCAWTREQTYHSLVRHTIEEAYEVADSIESGDLDGLKGELADLLNQVVFYSRLAEEEGRFDFKDIVAHLTQKLIDRHPDVFKTQDNKSVEFLESQWETLKQKERVGTEAKSILDGVVKNLPGLSVANKLQVRASSVGFDWQDKRDVLAKLKSEIVELEEAFDQEDRDAILDEVGDVIFSCVNFIRHMKADSEQVMRASNNKFETRFRNLEKILKEQGLQIEKQSPEQLEEIWAQVKIPQRRHPAT